MTPDNHRSSAASLPAVLLAARFLFPFDERRHAGDPHWRAAGRWLVAWGLLIGGLYALVFRVAWRWFGEYQGIRWLPVAAVLTVDLGCCGYRLLAGSAGIASACRPNAVGSSPPPGLPTLLAIVLVAITKYAMLLSLPLGVWRSSPAGVWVWEHSLARLGLLYPQAIYRPLILMPLWGRWAMTLAVTIGRVAPGGSNRLRAMARGTHLAVVVIYWLFCAAVTTMYCTPSGEHLARGVVIALAVMVVSYLSSFVLARRTGGQTEATVGTTALAAELAFLGLYLPVVSDIYWY